MLVEVCTMLKSADVVISNPGLIVSNLDNLNRVKWVHSVWAGTDTITDHQNSDIMCLFGILYYHSMASTMALALYSFYTIMLYFHQHNYIRVGSRSISPTLEIKLTSSEHNYASHWGCCSFKMPFCRCSASDWPAHSPFLYLDPSCGIFWLTNSRLHHCSDYQQGGSSTYCL